MASFWWSTSVLGNHGSDHSYGKTFVSKNTLAAKILNPTGDMTDTVVVLYPEEAASAGYTGKSAKSVGGATNIYLCMVDRCIESSRVYVVSRGVLWDARVVSTNVVIIDVRTETPDKVETRELASLSSSDVT